MIAIGQVIEGHRVTMIDGDRGVVVMQQDQNLQEEHLGSSRGILRGWLRLADELDRWPKIIVDAGGDCDPRDFHNAATALRSHVKRSNDALPAEFPLAFAVTK